MVESEGLEGCDENMTKSCPICCVGVPSACTTDWLHCPIER